MNKTRSPDRDRQGTADAIMRDVTKKKILSKKAKHTKAKTHKKVKKLVTLTKFEQKVHRHLKSLSRRVSKHEKWHVKVKLSLKVARKYMGCPKLLKIVENVANIIKGVRERKIDANETFTIQQKTLALLVMRKSVVAYKFLCRIFYLPPPRTLLNLLKMGRDETVITFTSGSLRAKAKALMEKVSVGCIMLRAVNKVRSANLLKKADLYCLVLFKEFNLKIHINSNMKRDVQLLLNSKHSAKETLADHCLVFMIRGIWEDLYKLPAAYVFYKGQASPSQLANLVKKEIRSLQNNFFVPIATICNEEGCNKEAINYLVRKTKTEFEAEGKSLEKNVFYVEGQEIVPLYDPPQLLVAMRNHLLRKYLIYTIERKDKTVSGTAKWDHIVEFYHFCHKDGRNDYVPKVTRNLVYPKYDGNMKLEDAAPIFSQKLAAFMGNLAGHHNKEGALLLSEDCLQTAFLLDFFNDLFDSVNGNRKESRYHDYNKLLTKVKLKSVHYNAWKSSLKALRTMKFVRKSGEEVNVSTIDSWIWTLEGFQVLMRNIFFNTILDGVWMRWFNQDPLNAIFKDYCDDSLYYLLETS